MIELKTNLYLPVAQPELISLVEHDCLAAHAYRQAIAEADGREIMSDCSVSEWVEQRASSLLKQWMGET